MGLFKAFVSQTRKPESFLGKMTVSAMNPGHARPADRGFTHLPAIAPESAADPGCGGDCCGFHAVKGAGYLTLSGNTPWPPAALTATADTKRKEDKK